MSLDEFARGEQRRSVSRQAGYSLSALTVARRILLNGRLQFALGRFPRSDAATRRSAGPRRRSRHRPSTSPAIPSSRCPGHSRSEILAALRRDSIYPGPRMPAPLVDEVAAFARGNPLTRWGRDESFIYPDVHGGRLSGGGPVVVASVREPALCPAVALMMRDPRLYDIAAGYLGYRPTDIRPVLFWTFASDLPEAERRTLIHPERLPLRRGRVQLPLCPVLRHRRG